MEEKIRFVNVSKSFQSRKQTIHALQDIDLTVYDGSLISIVGPSGCGKSTIIRMVCDIIKPTSGTILVDGLDINDKQNKKMIQKIGFVFQQPNLLPWLTIRQNIQMPLKIFRLVGSEWENYTDQLIEMVGLKDFAGAYPIEVSDGLKQRAGVIRAMVHKPEILLMDEPYGALDENNREILDFETIALWERLKTTIIFITHNVREAVLVSNKVYIMATTPGRIIDEVVIDFPYPRDKNSIYEKKFTDYENRIISQIGNVDINKIK